MKEPKIRFKGFEGEWEENKLTDMVGFYSGLTYSPNSICEIGTLVLRSSNVQNGEIDLNDNVFVDPFVVNSPNVQKGDIIIVVRNGSRALIGKHAQIKKDMNNTVIGAFMAGIRSNNPDFFNALLGSSRFDHEVEINLGATINQITNATFRSMSFKVPNEAEQHIVGNFFTTLDAQISASASRFASLKQVKSASLQAMFPQEGETVPKVRFKGFEGEWKKVVVGNIGYTYSGLSGKSKEDFGVGEAKFITFLNVLTNAQIDTTILESVDVKDSEHQNKVKKGDLFFNTSSETPEEVGMCAVLEKDVDNVYLNSFCFGFRLTDNNICPSFIAYLMRSYVGRHIMSILAQGATRYNLSKNNFCNSEIPVPASLAEQQAIATYFQTLDRQITLQSQRLEKLKQIKAACLDKMFV